MARFLERPVKRLWWLFRFSPLTRKIMAVNTMAILVLGIGLLYVGKYEDQLIQTELGALRNQAQVVAAALAEGAVVRGPAEGSEIAVEIARPMIRRLVEETDTRTRLFSPDGLLLVDSRRIGSDIEVRSLPPPSKPPTVWQRTKQRISNGIRFLFGRRSFPTYAHVESQKASAFPEVLGALNGDVRANVWQTGRQKRLIVTAAVPVQRYKQVLGAILVSRDGQNILDSVRAVQFDILKVFAGALGVTTLLSLYLGGVIVRPLRRLAHAAELVRRNLNRQQTIPNLESRRDEIGELSVALRTMTEALWNRMDAIERFAADVAHEIKNPLCSIRSAVETVGRIHDPERQKKLMSIINHDIQRLDRLISDISNASRLDAELSRTENQRVDMAHILNTLVDVHMTATEGKGPLLSLNLPSEKPLYVMGMETRLMQVFQNLISNAVSFSKPAGEVRLRAWNEAHSIFVTVEDDGPGILPGKEATIFERFYTERPSEQEFGSHSGLGLSISKQIVDAHQGTITAQNRHDKEGKTLGAIFTVRLPAL